jgi:hypothetical protein
MAETRAISEALIPLLSHGVPLEIVGIVGYMIAIDARLRSGKDQNRRTTFEKLGEFLESYDALLRRTQSVTEGFLRDGDPESLSSVLAEIKQEMESLGRNLGA